MTQHREKRELRPEEREHSILFITNPHDRGLQEGVAHNHYLNERCDCRFYDKPDNALARLRKTDAPPFQFVVFAAAEIESDFITDFVALKPRPKLIVFGPDREHIGDDTLVFVRDMYMLEGVVKRKSSNPARESAAV